LKTNACDIKSIITHLKQNNFEVLRRQIYRDLETIKSSFLNDSEAFVENNINDRKKEWYISDNLKKQSFDFDFILRLYFSKQSIPFLTQEQKEFDNWINNFIQSNSNFIHSHFRHTSESIVDSGFHQKTFNKKVHQLLKDLLWCISQNYKIRIEQKILDVTSCSFSKTGFVFNPLKLILHNGSLYIGGIAEKSVVVLDLCQILEYRISTKKYNNRQELLDQFNEDLSTRFGISENIDNQVYKIEVELSEITGEYLKKFNWHHTQKFKLTESGYTLTMECGINRELVSWIFQWMDNIRIVKPDVLKTIYLSQLFKSSAINTSDQVLRYSNVFLKKK
jgi:hypothetical protein